MSTAEQGNVEAQFNPGYMYEFGLGVERKNGKAFQWYTKSAEQGNEDAKEYLKKMGAKE
ncbi:MAG: hypothetical protein Q4D81_09780 [Eubacteriales bacterium]|nr:hypothetical protein [Eubacteriales bacterium]